MGFFIEANHDKILIPICIGHGEKDTIVEPTNSRWLASIHTKSEVKVHVFPGVLHEIYEDPDRDNLIKPLLQWVDEKFVREMKAAQ